MTQQIPTRDHAPEGDELREFEREFGAFDPPEQYQFEPEFAPPPPRPIPPELCQGRYCRQRRLGIIGLFAVGIVLLGCSLVPVVRIWGLYVLPLQYLHWIAAVLLLLSGVAWIRYAFYSGPFVYVEDGTPLVVRIVAMFLRVKLLVNGVPSMFEYVAVLQCRDPQTGDLIYSSATHDVRAGIKDEVTLSYRVGDYVTAVYLRSNPAQSLRLYGFLDLRPNLGIIGRARTREWTVLQLIGAIAGVGGFFFVLAWNVYAFGKFRLLEMSFRDHAFPFAIGAVVLGGGLLGHMAWWARRTKNKLEKNNREAMVEGGVVELPWQPRVGLFGQGPVMSVILLFGGALLGGGTMLCWALTLNALCDSSPPRFRPAHVREMWMRTHSLLFREYTIEYELTDDPNKKKQELLTTPWHMASFGPIRDGCAHVRSGFFGWPWVETLTPTPPNALLPQPPQDPH